MINKYFSRIKNIEFDLSSTCNAYCASCSRYVIEDNALKLNPHITFNRNVSLNTINKIFSSNMVDEDVSVPMVGSIGDPIANPQIVEIIQSIFKHKPNAGIVMHTNGGLRTPEIFKQLAEIESTAGKKLMIYFSIDGLADTNHIYRNSVNWNTLQKNVETYLQAGGRARWKFVQFEWNKHQVEQARLLADSMGFESFILESDRSSKEDREQYNIAVKDIRKKETARLDNQPGFRLSAHGKQSWNNPSQQECYDIQGIYINAMEQVLPCCKWNTAQFNNKFKDEISEWLYQDNSNWNNISTQSFESIMQNPLWEKLGDSFYNTVDSCTVCLLGCSKMKNG
jgi:hypothetical protein